MISQESMHVPHIPLAQAEATGADEDPEHNWPELSSRVILVNPSNGFEDQGRVKWGILATVLVVAGFIATTFKPGSGIQATSSQGWASFWASSQDPAAYRQQVVDVLRFQGGHACGPQLANLVLQSNISWKDQSGFESGAHCQRACTQNKGCHGFTWHWQWGCDLKSLSHANMSNFSTAYQQGSYSGYACRRKGSPYPWIYNEEEKHSFPQPKPEQPPPQASMLCLMVIRPFTYEVDLAIMQHKRRLSIFQCKHHFIYSNQVIQLAEGLTTRKFNSSQYAVIGGQWRTALNTDIFLAFWRAVLSDGDYLKAGWIVKVDPDTVWFPQRLSPILVEQEMYFQNSGAGAYFQNCWQGMHGPIEILSQNALRALALHSKQCFWAMKSWGYWKWGEDMWIDRCLKNTAFSRRIYNTNTLAEDHCNKWEGWSLTPDACHDQGTVAFHPFKDERHYMNCLNTALPKRDDMALMMKK